ncbi:hypothetical protein VTN77DRAFT_5639 [Rasamsonia byssochlamydoides]|uniref:uncharacterized protein n=1 Tax=Rasamsonia byssochlamydoides TaxID=89139 RepID=UPI0037421502
MLSFLQGPEDPYISIGLNNIVARETHVELDNRPSTTPGRTGSPSPAEKQQRYNLWPVIKKAVSSNLIESSGRIAHKLTPSQSSPSLRESESPHSFDSLTKPKPQKEGSILSRRNISIPGLGITPMATVRRDYMDSPTIPGRFPVHERSNSAPGVSATRNPFQDTLLSPVAEPCILFTEDDRDFLMASATNDRMRDAAAKPPTTEQECSKDSDNLTRTTNKPETEPEKPPAVPPKSPRMMGRSPPISQRAMTSKYTSPSRKAPSSNDEKTSIKRNGSIDMGSSSATHIATQFRNRLTRPRAATATDFRPSEGMSSRIHQRSESASAGTGHASETSEQFQARNAHKKEPSETPIMERGRPTRRRSPGKDRTVKGTPSTEHVAWRPLPSGVKPSEAASHFSNADMEKLQDQAREQAQKFEVLKYRDVKALSKELRVLDERCEYLRNTHRSLRSGRQALHERMISYLQSPNLSKYSCESMLRQLEALAELDQSIDEWITKLEHFENRRTRVRQKLLEHVAAALILQVTSRQTSEQQTPPQSPVNSEENGAEVSRQESIKVYADSKVYADANVYALFAEIEKEMERMNDSRNAPSRQENHAIA